ncbi:MAG: rhodanese-like domain-containing protein, partial [Pseudomonadota bacterium]
VLDGGLPKWKAEGHPIENLPPVIRDRHMTAERQRHLIKDITQVAAAAKLGDHVIIDARSPGRFRGDEAEPRPGLRAGHIPNSRNIHYRTLLNEDGTMKDADVLRTMFEKAGVDLSKPVITTCGSGVTAAILNLALERMGHHNHALYDGSWAEWGMYDDLKIATGDT